VSVMPQLCRYLRSVSEQLRDDGAVMDADAIDAMVSIASRVTALPILRIRCNAEIEDPELWRVRDMAERQVALLVEAFGGDPGDVEVLSTRIDDELVVEARMILPISRSA